MGTPLDLDELHKLLWNYAGQRVITVAGRSGILRRLATDRASADQVARELGLDPLATGKVLRALTALGLLEAEGDAWRVVAPLAPYFQEGAADILPFIEHSHVMYERWGEHLEPWLRGENWPTQDRTPDDIRRFGAAMQAMGAQIADRVGTVLDLNGVSRMLDVGGGFGHYARALCRIKPDLRATVLDISEVVALSREALAGTAFEGRIEFVVGDYLRSDYGEGYDLVLFANVLHQESCESAAGMIRRGAAALRPGGRIAVADFAIDDEQREHVLGTLFAINMRSFGDTHTEPTLRRWMEDAGLVEVERIDLNDYRWLIQARKPA
ncbi:MAG: methyltransferase [bacterium]|nr:methyltransferase [bacterium]